MENVTSVKVVIFMMKMLIIVCPLIKKWKIVNYTLPMEFVVCVMLGILFKIITVLRLLRKLVDVDCINKKNLVRSVLMGIFYQLTTRNVKKIQKCHPIAPSQQILFANSAKKIIFITKISTLKQFFKEILPTTTKLLNYY